MWKLALETIEISTFVNIAYCSLLEECTEIPKTRAWTARTRLFRLVWDFTNPNTRCFTGMSLHTRRDLRKTESICACVVISSQVPNWVVYNVANKIKASQAGGILWIPVRWNKISHASTRSLLWHRDEPFLPDHAPRQTSLGACTSHHMPIKWNKRSSDWI